jgi:hypothetical protein
VNEFDLDRLGSLWRTEPGAEELRELRRSAESARRRAYWTSLLDYGLAGVAVGTVLLILAFNPKFEAIMVGAAAVVVAIISLTGRKRARRIELQSLAGDTESMLESSIARVETNLKRSKSGLMVIGPSILLGVLFGFIVDKGGGGAALPTLEADAWRGLVVRGLLIFIIGATIIQLILSVRRSRAELDRLFQLREAYRLEHEATPLHGTENDD